MQGPLAAVVLLLELTHQADALMVPILLAVVEATVLARLYGAPSIYSARVTAPPGEVRGLPADQVSDASQMPAPSDVLPGTLPGEGA